MSKIGTFYAERRRFIFWSIFLTSVSWAIAATAVGAFRSDHRIGLDLNDVRCLPWRVYYITLGRRPVVRGDYVAFVASHGLMGPRFDGKLIGKQVAAIEGDHVVVKDDVLYINGKKIAPLYLLSRLHAAPGTFDRDQIVPAGMILALGTEPRSYDGRYWGWLATKDIIGTVNPLF